MIDKIYITKVLDRYVSEIICLFLLPFYYLFRRNHININRTRRFKKILLIKLWGIGNVAILLPIIEKFKEKYKEADLFFLTLDLNKGLTDDFPYLAQTFYVKFSTNIINVIKEIYKYLIILRKLQIDLSVNFEGCNRISTVFSYLIGAKSRIGFKIPNSKVNYLYNSTVDTNPLVIHASESYCLLAQKAGVEIEKYKYANLSEYIPAPPKIKQILEKYKLGAKTVALHVGSGDNFKGKRWKKENFAKLTDMLIEKHACMVVFTGTESERSLIWDTMKLMEYQAINLCNEFSIQELVHFLSHCYLFISNDTGPLHLAASLGINTVGFYGPSSPLNHCNLNDNSISFYKPVPCSPCLTNLNAKTSFCRNAVCLDNISVEEVFSKVTERFFKS